MELNVDWVEIKNFVTSRNTCMQYLDISGMYYLYAFDGAFCLRCQLPKTNPVNVDQADFEINFKPNANKKLDSPKDIDGSPLNRVKVTVSGWSYQLHGIEFCTSKLNSIVSKDENNVDFGYSSLKFYEMQGDNEIEITGDNLNQDYIDLNCVKTVIDWEPQHNLEIMGGMLKMTSIPSSDLRMWTIGVPDIPKQLGGSKAFAVNINLRFIGVEEGVNVDGRAPKYLSYSAQYHTNKIRMVFRHASGFKHDLHMIFELFKP